MKFFRQNRQETTWMVTYADMVTLLFVFFILLTAISARPKNCKSISDYMASNPQKFANYELRTTKLQCIISLPQDFLFDSGKAKLKEGALRELTPFFRMIKGLPEHKADLVVVEGHTDNVPIRTKEFPSNWELSSARSLSIARFLVDGLGYAQATVSIQAFADTRPKMLYTDVYNRPLKGRELKNARRANRRIEVLIIDQPPSREKARVLFDPSSNIRYSVHHQR